MAAFCHVGGSNTRLIAGDEVLQLSNLLLLTLVGCCLLGLIDGVHFLEFVVVTAVTGKLAVFQMIDNIDNLVEEGNVMGNQNEGMLVVLQELCEPFDMFNVKIVSRLVQQQNLGVLQQQLSKQNLAALTAGKLADVFIKTDAAKTEAVGKLFDFTV